MTYKECVIAATVGVGLGRSQVSSLVSKTNKTSNKQSGEVDKDNVQWKSPVITFKVTGPLSSKWNPPSVSRTALHSGLT